MNKPIRTTLKIVSAWILFAAISTGCVVVPIPVDDKIPYADGFPNPDKELVTKTDVIKRFGQPDAVYSHGSIYVYSDFEQTWEMPYFIAGPYSGADAGVAIFGDRHYLVLTFDKFGFLADRETVIGNGRADCSEQGIASRPSARSSGSRARRKRNESRNSRSPAKGAVSIFTLKAPTSPARRGPCWTVIPWAM